MKKFITIIVILILIIMTSLGLIYINYSSDIDAINSLNVNLIDLDLNDITYTSFKLNFDVEINNPSDRDIIDLSTDFEIFIEDNYVGEGNFSNVNISKNSKIVNDVVVKIYYNDLTDAVVNIIKGIINEGEFKLEINGTLYAKALFGISLIKQDYAAIKIYQ